MKAVHSCLCLVLCFAAILGSQAQEQVQVTFEVEFQPGYAPGADGSDLKVAKGSFASAFKLGFQNAVENAGCIAQAPIAKQVITYTPGNPIVPTKASIVFTYPVDPVIAPGLANGVAHVVANPALWFSTIDASKPYAQKLLKFIGPPGGFLSGSCVPALVPVGNGGECSPPPTVASPPPIFAASPPPNPACVQIDYPATLTCQSTITLGRATTRQLQLATPGAVNSALFVAGAIDTSPADIVVGNSSFDATMLVFSATFDLLLCDKNLPALVLVEGDGTYYILQSTDTGIAFGDLGSFTTCSLRLDSDISPPTPPSPPATSPPPHPPLPSTFPSPPPPFACAPNAAIISNIQFTGDYATVIAALPTFQSELAAALASLWCTCFDAIIVGTPTPLIDSQYNMQVPVKISYNTGVSFATNPNTCGVVSYTGLVDAFSAGANAPFTCFQRIASQDPLFAPQWSITNGSCNEAMVLSPPPPPPPPFTTPSSPPPAPPGNPPVYQPPPNPQTPPRPPPLPPALRRRLIDETAPVVEISSIEPTDVAYGGDRTLYEVFTQKSNFYEAGAICLARGATLATYNAETSQVFVDILCDASSGMSCWVDGMKAGRCTSVDNARTKSVSCSRRQAFVCMTQNGVKA